MGRNLNKRVRKLFTYNIGTNANECHVCGVILGGDHITNLKRHLSTKHSELLDDLKIEDSDVQSNTKKIKISYNLNEEELISSIVKIVTTDGRPSLILDSEGFREILNPIYDALSMSPITSNNIMNYVNNKEQAIKADIKRLVKGKLVSLKIDVATRMDKSILAVNLQIIHSTLIEPEIVMKTLGIIQLTQSHSRQYMKEKIMETIQEYGIELDHIFSITSDMLNGDSANESLVDDESEGNLLEKLDSIVIANIPIVRCVGHTLQLCVYDVNKQTDISEKINACRKLCKVLRSGKHRRVLLEYNKNIPPLDVVLRWSSTYTMLVKLLNLKDFVVKQSTIDINIDWDWLDLYVDAFKDTHETILKLQKEQLVYSDFFILWLELKLKCEKSQNYISKKILEQIKVRECELLQNEALLSAIYMDPRINLVLTFQQKMLAIQKLKKVAHRIFKLKQALGTKQNTTSTSEAETTYTKPEIIICDEIPNSEAETAVTKKETSYSDEVSKPGTETEMELIKQEKYITVENSCNNQEKYANDSTVSEEKTSLLGAFLDSMQTVVQTHEERTCEKLMLFYSAIENFHMTNGRLPISTNLLDYFQRFKLKSHHLSELALVVLATPATQLSIERASSALQFILSEEHSTLSPETINSFLVIKLNS